MQKHQRLCWNVFKRVFAKTNIGKTSEKHDFTFFMIFSLFRFISVPVHTGSHQNPVLVHSGSLQIHEN